MKVDFKLSIDGERLGGNLVIGSVKIPIPEDFAWQVLWAIENELGSRKTPPAGMTRLEMMEKKLILEALASTETYEQAAQYIGIAQKTLWEKRKRYNIE